jgi:hypothetical protein
MLETADLSLQQLEEIETALSEFLFAQPRKGGTGEPWAAGYKKDPKLFKQLIKALAAFKKDLLHYFQEQYQNRYWLIKFPAIQFAANANPDDFYLTQWEAENAKLAQIIEQHKNIAYDLGLDSLEMMQNIKTQITSDDKDMATKALEMAKLINEVTKKRISQAIQDTQKLNESRYQFDSRLKPIISNDDRAALIAEDQALPEFIQGRNDGATDAGWQYKTWDGVQGDEAEVCGAVIGETVQISDGYSNGLEPGSAHIGCRCWEDYTMIPDNPTL